MLYTMEVKVEGDIVNQLPLVTSYLVALSVAHEVIREVGSLVVTIVHRCVGIGTIAYIIENYTNHFTDMTQ